MNMLRTAGVFLFSSMWLIAASCAFSAKDANTLFTAYNSAFYKLDGTHAVFKNDQNGGVTYFWEQAEEIEYVEDVCEWHTNAAARGMIAPLLRGFLKTNGSLWTNNIYNDDLMWAVIAFARGGRVLGETNFLHTAQTNFDICYQRAYDTNLGGGLYWTTANGSKSACVNGPAVIAAALLGQITQEQKYWAIAINLYTWECATLFNPDTGALYDNLRTNGHLSKWSSTYNQGTFIGAANFLGDTNRAALAADFTITNLTRDGLLPQYGIAGNNSGFNAIFLRWLTRFMKDHQLQPTYEPFLQVNAAAAWRIRRTSDNLSWCEWCQPSPVGTTFLSWDCIASFEALQAADPTDN